MLNDIYESLMRATELLEDILANDFTGITVEPELVVHFGERDFHTGIEVGGEEVSRHITDDLIDIRFDTGAALLIITTDEGWVLDWFPTADEIIPLGYLYFWEADDDSL